MRPLILSNCERDFILQGFRENSRIDGRSNTDHRNITITFGQDRGSCLVVQGNTKVFAQVSCSTIAPNAGRPNEGSLFVNLELSPMAAPQFESGRLGDTGVEICRLLERTLKQSRCLDLESLCIVAGEMVWEIRVDIHVLDYDGAIVDCASVAAVCALKHFRRPDVSISGDHVQVHTLDEKEPVPLSMYHHPVCVTFGFCDSGNILIVDPNEKEEQVIDGKVVIAMNSHRELCAVHCTGSSVVQKEQLLRCTSKTVPRAKELVEIINKAFEEDIKQRLDKAVPGFASLVDVTVITGAFQEEHTKKPTPVRRREADEDMEITEIPMQKPSSSRKKGKTARMANVPIRLPTERDESDVEIVEEITKTTVNVSISENENLSEGRKKRKARTKHVEKDVQSLLNEIEDDVQILLPTDSGYKAPKPNAAEPDVDNIEMIDLADAIRPSKAGKRKDKKTQ